MTMPDIPIFCNLQAFRQMRNACSHISSPDAITEAAVAISNHINSVSVNWLEIDQCLQKSADAIRARVRGRQPQALIAHLHEYLFEELGLKKDEDFQTRPQAHLLPHVLQTKRGSPVALSLVYAVVGRKLGLDVQGINFPWHFLCSLKYDRKLMFVNPADSGSVLTVAELKDAFEKIGQGELEWNPDILNPANNRLWLTRMLQNLLNLYGSQGAFEQVAAMLEFEILLWPGAHSLWRDLALILARLGNNAKAAPILAAYLQENPNDTTREELQRLLQILRM